MNNHVQSSSQGGIDGPPECAADPKYILKPEGAAKSKHLPGQTRKMIIELAFELHALRSL